MTTKKTTEEIRELIEQGQGLVISLASRIRHNIPVRVDMEDLIAYGEIGLAEAARDFDETREVAFTTFAYYRVRGAIYDGVSKMSWTSRARYRRWRFEQMAGEYLEGQANSPNSASSLAGDTKWLRETTDHLAVVFFATHGDGSGDIRDSTIEDAKSPSAPAVVAQREISRKLHDLLRSLPKVEEELIRRVYFEGATLQDAGQALGISKSWASRLHAKALEQLSRSLRRLGAQD